MGRFIGVLKRLIGLGARYINGFAFGGGSEIFARGDMDFALVHVVGLGASMDLGDGEYIVRAKEMIGRSFHIRVLEGGSLEVEIDGRVEKVSSVEGVEELLRDVLPDLDRFVDYSIKGLESRVRHCLDCMEIARGMDLSPLCAAAKVVASMPGWKPMELDMGRVGRFEVTVCIKQSHIYVEIYDLAKHAVHGVYISVLGNACTATVDNVCRFEVGRGRESVARSIDSLRKGWWALSGSYPSPVSSELSEVVEVVKKRLGSIVDAVNKVVVLAKYLP